jgi:hypothetical protein
VNCFDLEIHNNNAAVQRQVKNTAPQHLIAAVYLVCFKLLLTNYILAIAIAAIVGLVLCWHSRDGVL